MSEYQFVAFRAINAPVSKQNLAYMRKQSSRAEITPWRFENEYHYSDFRGKYDEMLRRGYDIHLHYANFGIRMVAIRLPNGLPQAKLARPYLGKDSIQWHADKSGSGGNLVVYPYHDDVDYYEYDFDELMNAIAAFRAALLSGDLRPLYLAHLAMIADDNHDDDVQEGPIPAGLDQLTKSHLLLADFWGLSPEIIQAAAQLSPSLPPNQATIQAPADWLKQQPTAHKDAWLLELLTGSGRTAQAQLKTAYQSGNASDTKWPTVPATRTIAQLRATADDLAEQAEQKANQRAAKKRMELLVQMASDPNKFLKLAEKLVGQFSVDSYDEAGKLLADLREALSASGRGHIPTQYAEMLREKHPTKKQIVTYFRKHGLLQKKK